MHCNTFKASDYNHSMGSHYELCPMTFFIRSYMTHYVDDPASENIQTESLFLDLPNIFTSLNILENFAFPVTGQRFTLVLWGFFSFFLNEK